MQQAGTGRGGNVKIGTSWKDGIQS